VTPGSTTTGESNDHRWGDLRFALKNSQLTTSMADVMTLRYTGRVGIGTTLPGTTLDVAGPVTLGASSSAASTTHQINGDVQYGEQNNSSYQAKLIAGYQSGIGMSANYNIPIPNAGRWFGEALIQCNQFNNGNLSTIRYRLVGVAGGSTINNT